MKSTFKEEQSGGRRTSYYGTFHVSSQAYALRHMSYQVSIVYKSVCIYDGTILSLFTDTDDKYSGPRFEK